MRFGTTRFCSYTSADLKFCNRVFPHKVGLVVTNLDVLGVIEDEMMFRNLCDEDSVRLCLILALEVIFMGRLLTCPVDDSLFGLVENLEAWNVFPWGSIESSSVCTRDSRLKTRRLMDRVIRELNVRVFKLKTIIQVLALERNDKLRVIDIQEKDKNRSQNDKTEHENEKSMKEKSKLKPSQQSQVKVNPGMRHWKEHRKPNSKT
ncbi:hypothetical protein Tco_0475245 [Tanacetum coccineum]